MSHYNHKRHRSRSPTNKRELQQVRSTGYDRIHQSISSNRSYDYHHSPDRLVPIDEVISHCEEYSPMIQALVRELLLEQRKRKLSEERLNKREDDYALSHAQHEQTMNRLTMLKNDFEQCSLDLKNSRIELNRLRHLNCQYRLRIDQLLDHERQQMNTKRQRRR